MILVADSGSTKTDWGLIDNNLQIHKFETIGTNPYFYGSEEILKILQNNIPANILEQQVQEIYFYGAGCSSEERNLRVHKALSTLYPNARVIVDHDLLGAARALCGTKPGFAAIIGTGSNLCIYDGQQIIDQHGGIGYILGDEASGAYLGKQLIQRIFYGELPKDLESEFDKKYGADRNVLINHIYREPNANRYLASFALFYRDHSDHPYLQDIIREGFSEFFNRHITVYKDHRNLPFNALGSIAYHFKDLLKEVLNEFQVPEGTIIRKPIENLTNYHLPKASI